MGWRRHRQRDCHGRPLGWSETLILSYAYRIFHPIRNEKCWTTNCRLFALLQTQQGLQVLLQKECRTLKICFKWGKRYLCLHLCQSHKCTPQKKKKKKKKSWSITFKNPQIRRPHNSPPFSLSLSLSLSLSPDVILCGSLGSKHQLTNLSLSLSLSLSFFLSLSLSLSGLLICRKSITGTNKVWLCLTRLPQPLRLCKLVLIVAFSQWTLPIK